MYIYKYIYSFQIFSGNQTIRIRMQEIEVCFHEDYYYCHSFRHIFLYTSRLGLQRMEACFDMVPISNTTVCDRKTTYLRNLNRP